MIGIIGAFAGALGFACMYNLSGRNLWLAAFNGMMGQFVYVLAKAADWNEFAAMAAASLTVTLLAEILARICRSPATAYLVCALIPLVPGKGIFEAIRCWILDYADTGTWARFTFLQGAGIAAGCLIAAGFVRTLARYRKQKEAGGRLKQKSK
ncbi:threonine/serine exporter family protein [Faecalibaculum rodentium]|uniref:threonine/serine exporter family protein n=2 Tax=Faecalibaculum rodentium TaxID=1702221 RepID=UPI0023F396D3|nr:threonine/serine exporter family protein [Faecalibaculum rodentium]